MSDLQLVCVDCNAEFTFTEGEQNFYAGKQLANPKRCKNCRIAKKVRRMEKERGGGPVPVQQKDDGMPQDGELM